MSNHLAVEYAQALSVLEGNDFQAEVCTRLRSVILGFQDVPAKPQGDAGLDALSHNGECGYCCYGPEHNSFKTNQSRESGIVTKFSADLRRLFELEIKKKSLLHKENRELSTILPKGQRLKVIKLIVNWFESHRILGRLLTNVAEYVAASKCRYVDSCVSVVVMGPSQLADDFALDEITMERIRQRTFIGKFQKRVDTVEIEDPRDFEWKMDVLREIRPDQLIAIDKLADGLRTDWLSSLAFERELGDTVPTLHQALEDARRQIVTRVAVLVLSSSEPWAQVSGALSIAEAILEKNFGLLYGSVVSTVASGEVARLVGECTIGWQRLRGTHG